MENFDFITEIARKAVCKVTISKDSSKGYGFLAWFPLNISGKAIMSGIFSTNQNIRDPQDVQSDNIFFRPDNLNGTATKTVGYTWTNAEIDASFIEISPDKALTWQSKGARFLNIAEVHEGERILLVGYSKEGKFSVNIGQIKQIEGSLLKYIVGSNNGLISSGAPILNLQGNVVGIHRAFNENETNEKGFNKESIGVNLKIALKSLLEGYNKKFAEDEPKRIFFLLIQFLLRLNDNYQLNNLDIMWLQSTCKYSKCSLTYSCQRCT